VVAGSSILIVDDDRDARDVLAELLAREGYDVEVAADVVDAMRVLDSEDPPDAILLDLLMPGILGMSLLDYLHDTPRFAEVPVAIVSASPHLAPDGYPVFPKPLNVGTLIDFLHRTVPLTAHAG